MNNIANVISSAFRLSLPEIYPVSIESMKKYRFFLVSSFCILLPLLGFSQILTYGLRAEYHSFAAKPYVRLLNTRDNRVLDSVQSDNQWMAGLTFTFKRKIWRKKFYTLAELSGTYFSATYTTPATTTEEYQIATELRVLLGKRLPLSSNIVHINTGPALHLQVGMFGYVPWVGNKSLFTEAYQYKSSESENLSYGGLGGLEFTYRGFSLIARYNYSLRNIVRGYENNTDDRVYKTETDMSRITVGIGFTVN